MAKLVCGICNNSISFLASRHKTKDKQLLCSKCLKQADIPMMETDKYTLAEITSGTGVTTKSDIKAEKAAAKADIKENKRLAKGKTSSYCRFTALGVANTPFKWKVGIGFNELSQLTAGRIMIDYEYEYDLLGFTWTPKVKGQKNFSAGKALTGAALIGASGLVAGAAGKKGEDDSEILLTLKDSDGQIFKVMGKMDASAAESMSMFVTSEEAGL